MKNPSQIPTAAGGLPVLGHLVLLLHDPRTLHLHQSRQIPRQARRLDRCRKQAQTTLVSTHNRTIAENRSCKDNGLDTRAATVRSQPRVPGTAGPYGPPRAVGRARRVHGRTVAAPASRAEAAGHAPRRRAARRAGPPPCQASRATGVRAAPPDTGPRAGAGAAGRTRAPRTAARVGARPRRRPEARADPRRDGPACRCGDDGPTGGRPARDALGTVDEGGLLERPAPRPGPPGPDRPMGPRGPPSGLPRRLPNGSAALPGSR